jgi:hypothetical protein
MNAKGRKITIIKQLKQNKINHHNFSKIIPVYILIKYQEPLSRGCRRTS